MQLSTIPPAVLTANREVAAALTTAHELTAAVQSSGTTGTDARTGLEAALEAATQARDGVDALGAGNLLDGTFQRYSQHAVRQLSAAVEMLARPGRLSTDGQAIFQQRLFDAEVATRLGSEAGARSLAKPSPKALERATTFADSAAGGGSTGPSWVDGAWLDGLGNPVRGGDSWAGPDGDRYDGSGNPVGGDGSFTGPDGETYSGI
ncbi:MAG: hypothetical protein KDC46_07085 [Thermoleophilia bacterium]|nr:hypothetical protein [Thermoleophilia bacterium]